MNVDGMPANAASVSGIHGNTYYYINENGNLDSFCLTYYGSTELVYTPNGMDASDLTLTGGYFFTVKYITDCPEAAKEYYAESWGNLFPNAVYISEATSSYNCHSYAWYSQDTETNDVWMSYPNIYYSSYDMSYVEVDTPRVGISSAILIRTYLPHSKIFIPALSSAFPERNPTAFVGTPTR